MSAPAISVQALAAAHRHRAQVAETVVRWLRETLAADAQLTLDSRAVQPGDAFLAVPGGHVDGRRFIDQAIAAGAAAIVFEGDRSASPIAARLPTGSGAADRPAVPGGGAHPCPRYEIEGLAALVGPIAAGWYQHPSRRMKIVAVTGTNGKTSCTHWAARGLAASGHRCAVIGTLGSGVIEAGQDGAGDSTLSEFGLTTPDAVSLQRMLAQFVAEGVEVVAMEASSIGIVQGRMNGLEIDTAVFTNFSRDHLDFHRDEASYLQAKLQLFGWPGLRNVIVNGDDPVAPAVLDAVAAGVTTIAFGRRPEAFAARALKRVVATQIVETSDGVEISIAGDFGRAKLHSSLLGSFSIVNATAVAAIWLSLGLSFAQVVEQLMAIAPVPGRMQRIERRGSPLVVVDYAHTPEAISTVLQALRPVAHARGGVLWCLFGAGGDRDPGKRPLMGAAAEAHADRLVVTSDNPRSETPFRIAADIRAGLTREPWLTELDRAEALRRTLAAAEPADVILVAGKGHEAYQEVAGTRHPFSDAGEVERLLEARCV